MHLERLIMILETVAQAGRALSVAEICDATDLPKPSAYRLVQDLIGTGLLEAAAKGQFVLGTRLKRISRDDPGENDLVEAATPLLREATDTHGAAFFLSRLRGRGVEIVHVETPKDMRVSYLHPGLGFRPLHACSCAKAVAAFSEEPTLTKALSGSLRAYTEHTRTDPADLEKEFATIRKQGFAECVQELEVGICSVAAPVHLNDMPPAISLGATGSSRLFSDAYRADLGKLLIGMAATLGERLADDAFSGVAAARLEPDKQALVT